MLTDYLTAIIIEIIIIYNHLIVLPIKPNEIFSPLCSDCYVPNKVACPQLDGRSRIRCIDVTSICDNNFDCPEGEFC